MKMNRISAKQFAESVCEGLAEMCEGNPEDMVKGWKLVQHEVNRELNLEAENES